MGDVSGDGVSPEKVVKSKGIFSSSRLMYVLFPDW